MVHLSPFFSTIIAIVDGQDDSERFTSSLSVVSIAAAVIRPGCSVFAFYLLLSCATRGPSAPLAFFHSSSRRVSVNGTTRDSRLMHSYSAPQSPNLGPVMHRSREDRQTPNQFDIRALDAQPSPPSSRGVHVHDFEHQLEENRSRARSVASQRSDLMLGLDEIDDTPPLPDLQQRAIHIPLRTR